MREKLRQYHHEMEGVASVFVEKVRAIDADRSPEQVFEVSWFRPFICILLGCHQKVPTLLTANLLAAGCQVPHRAAPSSPALHCYRCAIIREGPNL